MKTSLRSADGFSLAEIMVTIAIMVVLGSLLFPTLQKSMDRQKQAVCAAQLRQVYHGVAAYTAEKGYFPPCSGGVVGETWGWWYEETSPLAEYGGGADAWKKVTICPLNKTKQLITSKSHVYGYPYAVNYNVMPTSGSYKIRPPASLPRMSGIVLMSDSTPGSAWGWGFDQTDPSTPTGGNSGGWARMNNAHSGKANLLWCDGHVTWQALETLVPANSLNKNLTY